MSSLPSPSSTSPTSSHLVYVHHHHQPPSPSALPATWTFPQVVNQGHSAFLACQGCFLLTLCCWCVQSSSMCYYMTCQRTSRKSTEMSVIGSLSYAKLRQANSFQVISFYLLLFQRAVLLHLIVLLISENGVNFLQKKKGGG